MCDRGPDGIKMMQEILKDKRIIYLKGNPRRNVILNAIICLIWNLGDGFKILKIMEK